MYEYKYNANIIWLINNQQVVTATTFWACGDIHARNILKKMQRTSEIEIIGFGCSEVVPQERRNIEG
jgi:hypothetical protein